MNNFKSLCVTLVLNAFLLDLIRKKKGGELIFEGWGLLQVPFIRFPRNVTSHLPSSSRCKEECGRS